MRERSKENLTRKEKKQKPIRIKRSCQGDKEWKAVVADNMEVFRGGSNTVVVFFLQKIDSKVLNVREIRNFTGDVHLKDGDVQRHENHRGTREKAEG